MGELSVMDRSGDTKHQWNPDNDDEVDAAEALFDSLIAKNYKAFRVGPDGKKTTAMKKFDPQAGNVIMVPSVQGG